MSNKAGFNLMKKIFKYYIGRIVICGLLLFIQLAAIIGCCGFFCLKYKWIDILFSIVAVILSLKIAARRCNIPCRIGWIIGILSFPILFVPMYLLYGQGKSLKKIKRYFYDNPINIKSNAILSVPNHINKQFSGLSSASGFPYFTNCPCEYYASGEAFFEGMKKDLRAAEEYILIEFFIINPGKMWDETLEILTEKARQGVKIYVLHDDMGTIALLPPSFHNDMKKLGIETKIFNLFSGQITPRINYRDHRKIVVVDGKYAITGGANIADEYINVIQPYGYWKDTAIRVEGKAVNSFTAMFIQMWNMSGRKLNLIDFIRANDDLSDKNNNGIVLPFGDYPKCCIGFSERSFLNMINNAQKEISITTPYFIPDSRLLSAMCLAAENGIKVRLFTPEIPDKKYIHTLTRANYVTLLKSGVEIYEYAQGFIHAKSIVCDKEIAYVGSANLDYRSLYIHFECGALLYKVQAVKQLCSDIENIQNRSQKINPDDPRIIKADKNIIYRTLRIISGLL